MPVALRDIDELKRLILVYVPLNPARQLIGDLYRSKPSERNKSLHETLRRLHEALQSTPTGTAPYVVTPRESVIADAERTLDDVIDELRKYLPNNENVRRGYVIAVIRDLVQIAIGNKDLVRELERRIEDRIIAPDDYLKRHIQRMHKEMTS